MKAHAGAPSSMPRGAIAERVGELPAGAATIAASASAPISAAQSNAAVGFRGRDRDMVIATG